MNCEKCGIKCGLPERLCPECYRRYHPYTTEVRLMDGICSNCHYVCEGVEKMIRESVREYIKKLEGVNDV